MSKYSRDGFIFALIFFCFSACSTKVVVNDNSYVTKSKIIKNDVDIKKIEYFADTYSVEPVYGDGQGGVILLRSLCGMPTTGEAVAYTFMLGLNKNIAKKKESIFKKEKISEILSQKFDGSSKVKSLELIDKTTDYFSKEDFKAQSFPEDTLIAVVRACECDNESIAFLIDEELIPFDLIGLMFNVEIYQQKEDFKKNVLTSTRMYLPTMKDLELLKEDPSIPKENGRVNLRKTIGNILLKRAMDTAISDIDLLNRELESR